VKERRERNGTGMTTGRHVKVMGNKYEGKEGKEGKRYRY
jgi:hypothetical protein